MPEESLAEHLSNDPLIDVIGEIGFYHWTLFTLTGLSIVVHGWQMLANKFLTITIPYHCRPPEDVAIANLTADAWLNISAPLLEDGQFDRCHIFDIDYSEEGLERPSNASVVECTDWVFDDSVYQNSVVQRWQLVCQKRLYPRIAQFLFFTGTMVGVFLAGFMADFYGRIRAYQFWLFLWIASTLSGTFVGNFWAWAAMRFVAGGASIAYNTCQTVYCIEFAGQKWRSVTNNIFRGFPFALGYVTLAGLVYIVPDMLHVEIVIGLSGIPFLIMLFFIPESPRWLLRNGQTKKGLEAVKTFCHYNKRPCDDAQLQQLEKWFDVYNSEGISHESANMLKLLKYPSCLRNLILISFCWFSLSMGSFGLAYNIPNFGMDARLVYVLPGLIILPLTFVVPSMENHHGRKLMLTCALSLAGVCLPLTLAVKRDVFTNNWPIIALAYIGQLGCSLSFAIAYSFTRELFPTSLRSSCLSFASACARLGSMLSPVVAISQTVNEVLPVTIYGIFCLLAAIGSIWVWPETKNLNLPESLEECEEMAKGDNAWLQYCRRRKTS